MCWGTQAAEHAGFGEFRRRSDVLTDRAGAVEFVVSTRVGDER
jgi:hypothetical protein